MGKVQIIIDNKSRLNDRDAVQFVVKALELDPEIPNKRWDFGCSITFKYEKITVGVLPISEEHPKDELFFYVINKG